jgi:hypothetical protein
LNVQLDHLAVDDSDREEAWRYIGERRRRPSLAGLADPRAIGIKRLMALDR